MRKKLKLWDLVFLFVSLVVLAVMILFAVQLLPTEEAANRRLFLGTIGIINEIDVNEKDKQYGAVVEQYLPMANNVGYLGAVEQIEGKYDTPQFRNRLLELRQEREAYLDGIAFRQAREIFNLLVIWLTGTFLTYVFLYVLVLFMNWVYFSVKRMFHRA